MPLWAHDDDDDDDKKITGGHFRNTLDVHFVQQRRRLSCSRGYFRLTTRRLPTAGDVKRSLRSIRLPPQEGRRKAFSNVKKESENAKVPPIRMGKKMSSVSGP